MPEDAAEIWLRTPVVHLGWRKPLDVIQGGGFVEVIDARLYGRRSVRNRAEKALRYAARDIGPARPRAAP